MIIVVLFLAFSLLVNAVNDGMSVKNNAYESAKQTAAESADMVTYSDFYMYRGNEAWDVIVGEDSEGNEIGVWIPVESTTDEESTSEEAVTEVETSTDEVATDDETETQEDQSTEEKPKQGYILPMDAYITEEEAVEIASVGKDVDEIVSVNLGMEDEVVLWEVTCINSKGNYSYYYVNASTGEMIKSYENI